MRLFLELQAASELISAGGGTGTQLFLKVLRDSVQMTRVDPPDRIEAS
jgi:hypothetical protein